MLRFDLSNRPAGGSFPEMHIIDMRGRHGLISDELADALRDAKKQAANPFFF